PKDKETNFGWRPFFQEGSSIAEKFPPNPPADHERDHETGADTLPAQPDNPKDASLKVVALELEEPGPTWVNLFYDLAWTATFASLTHNNNTDGLWGINGIAGTLYSVIWAPGPGLEGPIVYNVGCAALIITFIAYLYFESPTDTDISGLEDNRRSGYWMFCHLPLLLSIILLLIGVKKQFSLSCILSTATTMFQVVEEAINDEQLRLNYISAQTNMTIKNYLLRRGIVWQDEYDQLVARLTNGYTLDLTWSDEQKTEFYAWNYRISLKILVSTFNMFSGDHGSISNSTKSKIEDYYRNETWSLRDYYDNNTKSKPRESLQYFQILTEILYPSIQSARYIVLFAGLILISLGVLNIIHSGSGIQSSSFRKWAVISRIVMGILVICLLFLNVGGSQTLWIWPDEKKDQAGVFRWMLACWVLPTIALAFVTEGVIETALAKCYTNEQKRKKKTLGQ
ncbi:unnamed protein product, partial [Rhizoctonia solani]